MHQPQLVALLFSTMHVTTNPPHLLLLTILLLTTCGALGQQHPDGGCVPAERAALLSFKKGITIDITNRLASWHGRDCCKWTGVRCSSNETGRVLELRLRNEKTDLHRVPACEDDNALSGEISSSLLHLEQLEHMDLSGNCLVEYGKNIPSFLGSMKNLRYLNLSFIPSFGEVPPQLGNLSRLQYLDLGFNDPYSMKYSSDITWLKNLHSLQHLSMRHVNLSQISDWPQILNGIPSLRVIDFRDCSLESANQSLPHMNLTKLQKLDLSSNNFDHEISYCWFWKATSLKYLDISVHRFFGEFHDALENMSSLQVLDLSYSLHSRLLMKGLQNNLASNNLKVVVGAHWFPPFRLQNAHFASCPMGPLFPAWLQQQLEISELDLSSNALIDKIPNWFWQTFSLATDIDISNNQLSGTLPADLSGMSFLMLNLSSNQLTGKIPQFPRNITILDISRNSFSGPLPSIEAPQLKILLMFSNQIGGSIPESFCTLKELLDLDLSSNVLEGKIPHCFEFKDISFLSK